MRKFREKDIPAVESLLQSAWNYEKVCRPKTAKKAAKAFLYSCLAQQSFAQVALLNGKIAGIVMAKKIKGFRCPLKYRLGEGFFTLDLLRSKDGREAAGLFLSDHRLNRYLLKKSKQTYQGELSLFAVSGEAQGKGVGKQLFHSALSYMRRQGIRRYYLFTDTTCDYRYYDHQKMVRRCEKTKMIHMGGKRRKETFFLYDQSIQYN